MSESKKRRRKGEREDGRFAVTYSDGRNSDGSLHRIFFYGRTKSEAIRLRDEYKKRKESGLSEKSSTTTLNSWIDMWMEIYNINASMYSPYINKLKRDLGARLISSITEGDLVISLRNNYSGKSSSGATKYRMILQQVFLKAKKNRLIDFDPSEDLNLPKTSVQVGHRALERWETDLILSNWSKHRAGIWAMIMLLAGLRRGELIALDWSNIDMYNRTIRVCQTAVVHGNKTEIQNRAKTTAGIRSIPICQTLFDALSTIEVSDRTGFVALSAKKEKLSETAFSRGWEGFCSAMCRILSGSDVNIQGYRTDILGNISGNASFSVKPHDLRHTFCTMLYDGGIDVKSASYLMGHSDSRVTMGIYTHLSTERAKKSASTLIGVLDGFSSNSSHL